MEQNRHSISHGLNQHKLTTRGYRTTTTCTSIPLKRTGTLDIESPLPRPVHLDITILCLGIMLVELWFAEPIESRRLLRDLVNGIPNASTDLIIVER